METGSSMARAFDIGFVLFFAIALVAAFSITWWDSFVRVFSPKPGMRPDVADLLLLLSPVFLITCLAAGWVLS